MALRSSHCHPPFTLSIRIQMGEREDKLKVKANTERTRGKKIIPWLVGGWVGVLSAHNGGGELINPNV